MPTFTRFKASAAKVAVYNKPGSGDAPFTTPSSNLPDVYFHSDFDYYALAMAAVSTTISHLAVGAASPTSTAYAAVTVTSYNTRTVNDFLLATHNLGYIPRFLVADTNRNELPHGFPIQIVNGTNRCCIPYATTTEIRLFEIASYGKDALSSLSKTYRTVVFRDPAPVAGAPGFIATPTRVRMGFGKIDTNEQSLRVIETGETPFYIPLGPTVDIRDGEARFVLPDGTTYDLNDVFASGASNYGGSFSGNGNVGVLA